MTKRASKPKLPKATSEPEVQWLRIDGHVVAKKNLWRQGKGGKKFIDHTTKANIDKLTTQMRTQWRGRDPLRCAEVSVMLYVKDLRGDADNKYTTLQDCLVKAGILSGDTMARVPRFLVTSEVADGEEYTYIRLIEIREAFGL